MDLTLGQNQVEAIENERREEAANQLTDLQLMLVGGGNVTVIVG